jgi:transposase
MGKTYREWSPDQGYLFPPSAREWLGEDHLVYFLTDAVAEMDLRPIYRYYEREGRGQPPFHPRMMVSLLLFCYCTGTFSSRRIMNRSATDVACRVIVGNDIPNFRTISDFRKIHLAALEGLFVEVLKLCRAAGLAKVGRVALDGTKVKANASRHKAMSYERMQEEEKRLKQEIAKLLAEAESTDQREDAEHGRDRHGDELPEELARRESRLKKIRQAKKALQMQAKAAAEAEAQRRAAEGKPPKASKPGGAKPDPKSQRNFTDPDSKIMKSSNKGWDQSGNAQAVANQEQIILAADVTDQANDKQQLEPMYEATRENLKRAKIRKKVKKFSADAGYYSEDNVAYLEGKRVDPYIATGRLKHHEEISPPRGRPPASLSAKQRMARKLRTKRGRKEYGKRKGIIEPIFGQIKQARGFRQFLLRGLDKMRAEWRLICLTHNLLKLHRHQLATT